MLIHWCISLVLRPHTATIIITAILAMSESPEVCQFSSTVAISQHCYNVAASNWVQRFFKGLGTFTFTNYVKISALVKNTWTFSSYFIIFLCNSEVITGFILLLTVTCNIWQWTTIFAYQTGCKGDSAGFWLQLWSSSSGNATIYSQKTLSIYQT